MIWYMTTAVLQERAASILISEKIHKRILYHEQWPRLRDVRLHRTTRQDRVQFSPLTEAVPLTPNIAFHNISCVLQVSKIVGLDV